MNKYKGYKYRIYPTKEQQVLFAKTFGCCRFVYNYMLTKSLDAYEKGEKLCSRNAFNYLLTPLKKEYVWLQEVDATALTSANDNLADSFSRFFKKQNNFPNYRSRKRYSSYTSKCVNGNIFITDKSIKLPKVGLVKAKIHRMPEGEIKSATVSMKPSGKYYISLKVEFDPTSLPISTKTIGIDMGVRTFYTTDNGVKVGNPKNLKQSLNKLKKEQRKLSRKKKGSNNRNKQRIRVAKTYEKITNQRLDFLQKESTKLISENQVVCIEDIKVRDLLISDDIKTKKHNINRAQLDTSWHKFFSLLEYKSNWYGRTLIKVSYPSSETCSSCGTVNSKLKDLLIRNWKCPTCGKSHDRDINAAINIKREGLRLA